MEQRRLERDEGEGQSGQEDAGGENSYWRRTSSLVTAPCETAQ